MSYARKNGRDSDVYVYRAKDFECCGCILEGDRSPTFPTHEEIIEHLLRHRQVGHKVPDRTFERLLREMQT